MVIYEVSIFGVPSFAPMRLAHVKTDLNANLSLLLAAGTGASADVERLLRPRVLSLDEFHVGRKSPSGNLKQRYISDTLFYLWPDGSI